MTRFCSDRWFSLSIKQAVRSQQDFNKFCIGRRFFSKKGQLYNQLNQKLYSDLKIYFLDLNRSLKHINRIIFKKLSFLDRKCQNSDFLLFDVFPLLLPTKNVVLHKVNLFYGWVQIFADDFKRTALQEKIKFIFFISAKFDFQNCTTSDSLLYKKIGFFFVFVFFEIFLLLLAILFLKQTCKYIIFSIKDLLYSEETLFI